MAGWLRRRIAQLWSGHGATGAVSASDMAGPAPVPAQSLLQPAPAAHAPAVRHPLDPPSPYHLKEPTWRAALHETQDSTESLSRPPGARITDAQDTARDVIDLHTFHPRDIPSVVEEFLWEAQQAGLEHLRIIHGKGKGVQKQRVQKILASHAEVVYFTDAPPEAGGWGATLVTLKRARSFPP